LFFKEKKNISKLHLVDKVTPGKKNVSSKLQDDMPSSRTHGSSTVYQLLFGFFLLKTCQYFDADLIVPE
jgi:hypothetical protein